MTTIPGGRRGAKLLYAALLSSSALVAAPAAAQSWVGGVSTDWNDPNNWSTTTLPPATGVVVVDNQIVFPTISAQPDTVARLTVADTGPSALRIDKGGHLTVRDQLIIGNSLYAPGGVTVTGAGSRYDNSGDLALPGTSPGSIIGNAGGGNVSVLAGAVWDDQATILGAQQSGIGTMTIDGAGSVLGSTRLVVGDLGQGTVTVSNGGELLSDDDAYIGNQATSKGEVDVTGPTSFYEAYNLTVGNFGQGMLTLSNHSGVTIDNALTIGADGAPLAVVKVDSGVLKAKSVDIGEEALGYLYITNGGQLQVSNYLGLGLGFGAKASGTLTVDGQNSSVIAGQLALGNNSFGEIDLSNAAQAVFQGSAIIGNGSDAKGIFVVKDTTSSAAFAGTLEIGRDGNGSLRDSGAVNSLGDVVLGVNSTGVGSILVDGGILTTTGALTVGQDGQGSISVLNNGQLNPGSLVLAQDVGSNATAQFDNKATMVVANDMTVGLDGNGSLLLSNMSSLRVDGGGGAGSGTINLATNADSYGVIYFGSTTNTPVGAGSIDAAKIEFGAGQGQLNYNASNTTPTTSLDAVIDGGNANSTILVRSGVMTLTADSSGFKGSTLVRAVDNQPAVLRLLGTLGGTVMVGGAGLTQPAELIGTGTVLGAVTITDNGELGGIGGQTLTMGSLTLESGANVTVVLGNAGGATLFKVNGDLTLDGTLDVANSSFGQGVYRLFDYGGALTDNGLNVGSVSSAITPSDLTIQTAVAGQVNLVYNTGGASPPPPPPPPSAVGQFWDGDGAGNAGNGKIDAGDGTWTATSTNFTDANGTVTGTYDPTMVVFEGQGGNVVTSNANGALHVAFMQFMDDQFQLSGDTIALDPGATINVGDFTPQGANYVGSIANVLTGSGGLTKDGLGTLNLSGENTYTGGTKIAQGQLVVGNGGATGSIIGDVDDEGVLTFFRSGTTTFDGVISGAGDLNSIGDGTLTLTAANPYTGATGVGSGTLALTGNGSIASSSGLYLEFATFDVSGVSGGGTSIQSLSGNGIVKLGANTLTITKAGNLAYDGSIQGTGGLHIANGQLTLLNDNTYTGGTVIDTGGTLAVGDGHDYGSITGDVVNNGIFAISRSDDVTFAGNISGKGIFGTEGSGSVRLTGTNSYTGGTIVFGTTLIGDTKSLQGQIQSTGHLVFDQSFDGSYAGVISGTGDVTKSGSGTLMISNAQGYTGATTINGGGLVALAGLAGSDVTLNAGFLGGYGPVKSLTVNGGTLSPGQSPGTMVVLGDAALGANSTYAVDLAGMASDHLVVGGKVTLSGGTLTLNGTPVFGVGYQIVQAQGGVTGTFGTVGGGIAKPFESTLVSYQPDAVTVTLALNGPAVVAAAKTPNEKGAASDVVSAPLTSQVVAAVAGLDLTSAPGAFDQLSGEIHASLRGAITEDARAAGDRLIETIGTRRGLWGEATIGNRRIDGDGNAATVKGSVRSVLAGIDGGNDAVRVGVVAGYGWSNIDVAARDSSARMEALRIGSYLAVDAGNGVELKTVSLYSRWRGDVSRGVSFTGYNDRLTSNDRADMLQGMAEIGWKVKAGAATVEPFGSLDWVEIGSSAISEKGGAAALTGQVARQDSWFGKLGVRASAAIPSGSVTITPRASIAWERAFGDSLPTANLAFAGNTAGGTFAIDGPIAPRDRANAELGIGVTGRTLDIGISAGGSYASRTAQTDVKLHLRWQF